MCILDELYYEWHSPRELPEQKCEEIHEEWGRNEDLWTQAEKSLDPELLDQLQRSVSELMELECCQEFQAGFRLGVQLMLEIL